ncbi:RHS repeat-associated core domain-containing protein [Chryseobacterium sp. CBSDS_008]|uniref:RHS repeat-associated core domain-containing protein n=1 Tax=Chryseobacterium sp. CBSDS_008 TaxID=3415265 RepID=UPI003CECD431
MLEQQTGVYDNPYKFNAKELDRETGLYYYGARYYNPRASIWYGVDPLAVYNPAMETQFYGDGEHNGGVFYWGNLNPYIYTYQNPIKYIDPDGKQVDIVKKYEGRAHNFKSFETNGFRVNPNTQTWYFDHTANTRNKTAKFIGGIFGIQADPQNTVMAGPVLDLVKNTSSVKQAQVELAKLLGKDGKIENGETQGYFYDIGKIGGQEFWKIAMNSLGDFISGKFYEDNTSLKKRMY